MLANCPRQFRRVFRMHPRGFQYVLGKIDFFLKYDALGREYLIDPVAQLGLFVYHVAHGASMPAVGQQFGLPESTANRYVHRVRDVIIDQMYAAEVSWPTEDEKQEIASGFHAMRGIRACIGCIDGTHVPVRAPAGQRCPVHAGAAPADRACAPKSCRCRRG